MLYRDQAATFLTVLPHQPEHKAGAEADLGTPKAADPSSGTSKNCPSQPKEKPSSSNKR